MRKHTFLAMALTVSTALAGVTSAQATRNSAQHARNSPKFSNYLAANRALYPPTQEPDRR